MTEQNSKSIQIVRIEDENPSIGLLIRGFETQQESEDFVSKNFLTNNMVAGDGHEVALDNNILSIGAKIKVIDSYPISKSDSKKENGEEKDAIAS